MPYLTAAQPDFFEDGRVGHNPKAERSAFVTDNRVHAKHNMCFSTISMVSVSHCFLPDFNLQCLKKNSCMK